MPFCDWLVNNKFWNVSFCIVLISQITVLWLVGKKKRFQSVFKVWIIRVSYGSLRFGNTFIFSYIQLKFWQNCSVNYMCSKCGGFFDIYFQSYQSKTSVRVWETKGFSQLRTFFSVSCYDKRVKISVGLDDWSLCLSRQFSCLCPNNTENICLILVVWKHEICLCFPYLVFRCYHSLKPRTPLSA